MNCSSARFRAWAITIVAGVLGAVLVTRLPIAAGDTIPLAQSSRALIACARAAVWSNCPGAGQFGLQQHLAAMFFAWKGFDDQTNLTALTVLNLAAFGALLTMLTRSTSLSASARRLAVVALLLGPTLAYSVVSFGESLNVAVAGALVLVLAERQRPSLIATLAAFACTAGETSFISVLLIGLAVLVGEGAERASDRRWWSVDRGRTLGLVLGCVIGMCLDAMFNFWRYGGVGNAVYDSAIFRTPGVWLKVKSSAALWISPGGGAFVYWFLGALVVIALPLLALLSRDSRRMAAGLLVLLGAAGETALLSAWWTPFGWYAWGPRLLLPTLAMAVVAVVAVFQRELSLVSEWLRRRIWAVSAVGALSLLSAAANLGFLARPSATLSWFYTDRNSACFAEFTTNRASWYACVHGPLTWDVQGSLWTSGITHIRSPVGVVLLVSMAVALVALADFERLS